MALDLLRSSDMTYARVLIPSKSAHKFVSEMIQEGVAEFEDLNKDMQAYDKRYMREIIQIVDIDRKVSELNTYLKDFDCQVPIGYSEGDVELDSKVNDSHTIIKTLDEEISGRYLQLRGDVKVYEELYFKYQKSLEMEHVLRQSKQFLSEQNQARQALFERKQELEPEERDVEVSLLGGREGKMISFSHFAGVMNESQRPAFQRQIFLASRGKTYAVFSDIEFDEKEHANNRKKQEEAKEDPKVAFIVFFLGENLGEKLKRLCEFMKVRLFLDSDRDINVEEKIRECKENQATGFRVLSTTEKRIRKNLKAVEARIGVWKTRLLQEKSILHTLNKFKDAGKSNTLLGHLWVPSKDVDKVESLLEHCTKDLDGVPGMMTPMDWAAMKETPPTHFSNGKYTELFQVIVDTYGTPLYKEVNPAVFTIITFPFFFGVMYGDVVHGSYVLLVGLFLLWRGEKMESSLDETARGLGRSRYLFFMMGIFAVYCGFIYNDALSLPVAVYPSSWSFGDQAQDKVGTQTGVYPFGIDWAWYHTDSQLLMFNSVKMKMAIIFGVAQMGFGLFLSLMNIIYRKDKISFLTVWIPEFLFLTCFFGYMCLLMVIKWCTRWPMKNETPIADRNGAPDYIDAPSIIVVMIDFFMNPSSIAIGAQIFPDANTQQSLQSVFIILILLSIPWLLVKPFVLNHYHKQAQAVPHDQGGANLDLDLDPSIQGSYSAMEDEKDTEQPVVSGHGGHDEEEFVFFEELIHQVIHMIEFALGTVSNTASYLRLWALSLAHAELAEVFWGQTMDGGLNSESEGFMKGVMLIPYVALFFCITAGVLLGMDVLECFLHALRLHWVEFQNKFYHGDGRPFEPDDLLKILKDRRHVEASINS